MIRRRFDFERACIIVLDQTRDKQIAVECLSFQQIHFIIEDRLPKIQPQIDANDVQPEKWR